MRTILAGEKKQTHQNPSSPPTQPPKTNILTEYQNPRNNKTQPSNDNNPASKKKPHKPSLPIAKRFRGAVGFGTSSRSRNMLAWYLARAEKKGADILPFYSEGLKIEAYY